MGGRPRGREGLKLTKVHELLTREGVDVSYSSVYRYAVEQFGLARSRLTLRRAEVSPGELAEVDFGQLGKIYDPDVGAEGGTAGMGRSTGGCCRAMVELVFALRWLDSQDSLLFRFGGHFRVSRPRGRDVVPSCSFRLRSGLGKRCGTNGQERSGQESGHRTKESTRRRVDLR